MALRNKARSTEVVCRINAAAIEQENCQKNWK